MSTYRFPSSGCWLNRLASSSRERFSARMCACFSRSRSSRSRCTPSSSFRIAAILTLWISSDSTKSACAAIVSGVLDAPGGGSDFFTAFLRSSAASRAAWISRVRRAKSANAPPSSQTSCSAAPARWTETVPSRAPTAAISRRACARSCCARRTASCFTPSTRARSRCDAASSRDAASRASAAAASLCSRASASARSSASARRFASSASFLARLPSSRAASSAATASRASAAEPPPCARDRDPERDPPGGWFSLRPETPAFFSCGRRGVGVANSAPPTGDARNPAGWWGAASAVATSPMSAAGKYASMF